MNLDLQAIEAFVHFAPLAIGFLLMIPKRNP